MTAQDEWDRFVQERQRAWDTGRAPWAPRETLREATGRVVGRYALGLAALADLLRGPR